MQDINENAELMTDVVQEPVQLTTEQQLAEYEATLINPEGYEVTQKALEAAIAGHLRLSTKLSEAWTLEEVKAFLEFDIVPAKTSNGVWVNDVTRGAKKAGSWSTEELEAWALGEIQPVGRASSGALAQALVARLGLKVSPMTEEGVRAAYLYQRQGIAADAPVDEPAPVETLAVKSVKATKAEPVQKTIAITKEGLTAMNQKFIENVLQTYCAELKPGKAVTMERGLELQRSLETLFRYVLDLPDPAGFKSAMDLMLDVIKRERNGVFEETYAMRFTASLPVAGNVQENHIRLLNLFLIYTEADQSMRKQADVSWLLEFVPESKKGLMLQYFQQYK